MFFFLGRGILTAAFDGGCYCALHVEMHCFGFLYVCYWTARGTDFILRGCDKYIFERDLSHFI